MAVAGNCSSNLTPSLETCKWCRYGHKKKKTKQNMIVVHSQEAGPKKSTETVCCLLVTGGMEVRGRG